MPFLLILAGIVSFSLICGSLPSLAATRASVTTQDSATQKTDQKQTDEQIRTALKNFSDSAHHLQQTIHEIIFEITRQEYATVGEPNVIGSTVIPAIPMPTGQIAIGVFFPPREKYMTHYAKQTHDLLVMLTEESASLPFSLPTDSTLTVDLASIRKYVDGLKSENDNLQKLMAGPTYNNLLIGKQALKMSDDLDQIKNLLKESEKSINKDIKQDK